MTAVWKNKSKAGGRHKWRLSEKHQILTEFDQSQKSTRAKKVSSSGQDSNDSFSPVFLPSTLSLIKVCCVYEKDHRSVVKWTQAETAGKFHLSIAAWGGEASRRNKKKTHKKPLCAITSIAIHIAWILSAVLVYVRVYQFVNFLKASECRSSRRRAFYYIYGFFGTKEEIKNCSYSRMKMAQALARLFCMENYYESQ